jgi:hypothetical protein
MDTGTESQHREEEEESGLEPDIMSDEVRTREGGSGKVSPSLPV